MRVQAGSGGAAFAGWGGRPVWSLVLYPAAGEAGGALVSFSGREGVERSGVADPVRSAQEAARRARGKVRRYCAANRLNRFGTLTYAGEGCHDPVELRGHVAGFFRHAGVAGFVAAAAVIARA